jgi:hypothetical protein
MKFESKFLPLLLLGGLRLTHGQEVPEVQEACAAAGLTDPSAVRRLTLESGRDLVVTGGAIISNGVVTLGILDAGHLNIADDTGVSPGVTGIRWNDIEATSWGCPCEGWGASASGTGAVGVFSGWANDSSGSSNIAAEPIVVVGLDEALTDVKITTGPLRVTHYYEPAPETVNLYVATVTYENTDAVESLTELRYRRVMDWDIPPSTFSECVSIDTGEAVSLEYASDNGFVTSDPLSNPIGDFLAFECPLGVGCPVFDSGPQDHGAVFQFLFKNSDLSLVQLGPGEKFTFKIYYGGAGNKEDATAALAAVEAEVSRVKISAQ